MKVRGNRSRSSRPQVTIQDVAIRAGVSTATVSRTLANPAVVSAKTRERVLHAVEATGYTPNVAARNLRARRSMMILVIVPNVASPFIAEVLRGIDDELVQSGYDMIIGNLDNLVEREARYVKLAQSGQVDGVMITSGRIPCDGERSMVDLGIPMAAVCAAVPGLSAPHITVDDRRASIDVATHFLELGHRRFGYISGPSGNVNEVDRYKGFLEGLKHGGVAAEAVTYWSGQFNLQAGVDAARAYLELADPPTAVYAACDEAAIGFMKMVSAAGRGVPGDVSVVGFDGIDVARFVQPSLTTMRQPRYELGRTGARALLRTVNGLEPDFQALRLPAPLVLGASTGPVSN